MIYVDLDGVLRNLHVMSDVNPKDGWDGLNSDGESIIDYYNKNPNDLVTSPVCAKAFYLLKMVSKYSKGCINILSAQRGDKIWEENAKKWIKTNLDCMNLEINVYFTKTAEEKADYVNMPFNILIDDYPAQNIDRNNLIIMDTPYNKHIAGHRATSIEDVEKYLITMTETTEKGMKFDSGKLEWDLLPFDEVEEIVKVLDLGAKKYSKNNWQHVKPKNRYINAAFRHLIAYIKGEKIDSESNLSHLAHAACNLLFLMWHDKHENEGETNG